jgi:hypothetical protein
MIDYFDGVGTLVDGDLVNIEILLNTLENCLY